MKLRKMLISAVLISLLVIVLGVLWLLTTNKSVIWSFRESGDPSGEPSFVIFNPFRGKQPEATAEELLNLLKNGECPKAVRNLKGGDYAELCERESQYPLEDWKLSNRNDIEGLAKLYYRVKRASHPDYNGQLWIDLEETANGWKVTDIEAVY
ncbi:MAG: hypothetical protein WBD22_02845 [Pyrinomonadaceae bacterium]